MSLGAGREGRAWETVAAKSKRSESERIFIIVFGMGYFFSCDVYLCGTKGGIYSKDRLGLRYDYL